MYLNPKLTDDDAKPIATTPLSAARGRDDHRKAPRHRGAEPQHRVIGNPRQAAKPFIKAAWERGDSSVNGFVELSTSVDKGRGMPHPCPATSASDQ